MACSCWCCSGSAQTKLRNELQKRPMFAPQSERQTHYMLHSDEYSGSGKFACGVKQKSPALYVSTEKYKPSCHECLEIFIAKSLEPTKVKWAAGIQ